MTTNRRVPTYVPYLAGATWLYGNRGEYNSHIFTWLCWIMWGDHD